MPNEFRNQQGDIQDHYNNVDIEQMLHHPPSPLSPHLPRRCRHHTSLLIRPPLCILLKRITVAIRPQNPRNLKHIKTTNNRLLHKVTAQLKPFPESIRLQKRAIMRRHTPKDKYRGRNIADEDVRNDDAEYPLQLPPTRRHEVQARVQHDALPRHHALPSHIDDRDAEHRDVYDAEEFEQQAQCIQHDGNGGDDERPEVQAFSRAEGYRDEDEELDGVVEGDAGEGGDELRDLEAGLQGAGARHAVVHHFQGRLPG